MDMGLFGADGAFYLLTATATVSVIKPTLAAGMYKWEYVKGKARAQGRAVRRQDRRRRRR